MEGLDKQKYTFYILCTVSYVYFNIILNIIFTFSSLSMTNPVDFCYKTSYTLIARRQYENLYYKTHK